MKNYSEKEMKLIAKLEMLDVMESKFIVPPLLYNMMAMKCFMDGRNDEISDSVRRCLIALSNHTESNKNPVYRLTQEFDDLIQID